MKILICTPVFYPSVGGLETINLLLGRELVRAGNEVVIVTPAVSCEPDNFPFRVVRCPDRKQLMALYKWCDIFVHNAIVLKYVYPILLFRKPFVAVHHSSTFNWDQSVNIQSFAKRMVSLFAHNISVSEAVANNLRLPHGYTVIHNFFDSSLFRITNRNERSGFVYVGRLSFEKGLFLLIDAYCEYLSKGGKMGLTIVGDGYQKSALEKLVMERGIGEKVLFTGIKRGEELCGILNNNRTLVLPSICKEAFGIVILEAMACGCYCIGSDGDGIQEAMGPFGKLFIKSDKDSLASAMVESDSLSEGDFVDYCEQNEAYLRSFSLNAISLQWLSFFRKLI